MKKEQSIKASLLLFWMVSVINLVSGILEWSQIEALSKAFIIPILAVYLIDRLNPEQKQVRKWLLGALFFSWLGDVLLLGSSLASQIPFFLMGLAAFLIAHLIFLISFLKIRALQSSLPNYNFIIIAPISVYLVGLLFLLWDGLDNGMKVPVLLYGVGISAMAVVGFQLKPILKTAHFYGFFGGVLLFLLSDSIIGINRFAFEIPYNGFLIMSTYIAAQFLIVHHLSHSLNENNFAAIQPNLNL